MTEDSSSSAAPRPKSPYRPEIDGLRAFAVVAVIINHFNKDLLPSGYLGVDIFFVISGYVITSSLANHRSDSFGDFFLGFYARRVKRLVPALVVFVLVTLTVASLFIPKEPPFEFNSYLRTGATALIGLSNLYLFKQSTNYFASPAEYNVFTHTWSLGVEEQFYLLFPFLIWLSGFGRTTGKGERNLFWATLILSIGSLASFIYLYSVNQSAAYFLMPSRIWELGSGCLIFIALQHHGNLSDRFNPLSPNLIATALVVTLFIPLQMAPAATIAIVFLTVLLLTTLRQGRPGYSLFSKPIIVYIGMISYSLYLWHWGVLCISRWTIGIRWWSWPFQVALMLIIAAISYRYIEMPLRKINNPFTNSHVIGVGMLASLGSALFLLAIGRIERINLFLGRNVPDISFGEIPSELNRQGAASKIIVLGNSYAHHLLPLVSRISETFNLSYLIKATSSKPIPSINGDWQLISSSALEERLQIPNPSLSLSDKNGVDATYAPTIDKEASEALAILKPRDLLILSSRHFGLYAVPFVHNGSIYYLAAKGDKGEHLSTQTLLKLWTKKLQSIVTLSAKRNSNVVFIMQPPEFRAELVSSFLCTKQWYRPSPPSDCFLIADRKTLRNRFFPGMAMSLLELTKNNSNFFIYDPFDKLCPPGTSECTTFANGIPRFSDNDHLSREGSLLLVKDFAGFLAGHHLIEKSAR